MYTKTFKTPRQCPHIPQFDCHLNGPGLYNTRQMTRLIGLWRFKSGWMAVFLNFPIKGVNKYLKFNFYKSIQNPSNLGQDFEGVGFRLSVNCRTGFFSWIGFKSLWNAEQLLLLSEKSLKKLAGHSEAAAVKPCRRLISRFFCNSPLLQTWTVPWLIDGSCLAPLFPISVPN